MPLPACIAPATLETVIGGLAHQFRKGAGGDMDAAHFAASQMLAAYHAETPDELTLAGEIVSLQLHTLEALSDAADPDLSLNKVLRLRVSAVSLSRESHKARRELARLQRVRLNGVTPQAVEAAAPEPAAAAPNLDDAVALIEEVREAIQTVRKSGGQSWSQSFQKRQTAKRIADTLKKKQAEYAASAGVQAVMVGA